MCGFTRNAPIPFGAKYFLAQSVRNDGESASVNVL